MKKQLLTGCIVLIASLFSFNSTAQFWTEDFGVGCDQGNQANGTITANGTWTVTLTGANGGGANEWFISATEAGMGVGNCGDGCLANAAATSRTLHVGNVAIGTGACLFCPTGDCGAAYADGTTDFGFCPGSMDPTMNARAESPTINCSGQTGITLDFAYITNGQPGVDFCTVEYFDGGAWSTLGVPTVTSGAGCGGQHQWAAYSIALPASADNNANVKIGFRWQQVVDDGGADPSFAVDDITLTSSGGGTPPVADFSGDQTNICEGTTVTFTDLSTNTPTSWLWNITPGAGWTFSGGTSNSDQNPQVDFTTAGTYTIELTATNADGSDTETKTDYITVVAAADAGADNTGDVCNNNTLDLNTLLSTAQAGTWVETSGTPSGQFTPGTGILDGNGLTVGNIYTFEYTVTGTAPCPDDVAEFTITVIDCSVGSPPTAAMTGGPYTICVGDCINFTDASTVGANPNWSWTFNGADTPTSSDQNPLNICYSAAGTYDVTLEVTDDIGTDTHTEVGYVTVVNPPDAGADNGLNACNDQTYDLNLSLVGADAGGTWVETSGTPSGQFTPGTGVLDANGLAIGNTYTFEYTVTDGGTCPDDVAVITVDIVDCTILTASFTPSSTNICVGDCITFVDGSTGPIVGWGWQFTNGTPANAITQDPGSVCFNTPGAQDVILTVTDGVDTDDTTITITVNALPTIDAGTDQSVCIGDDVTLTATGGNTYSWTGGVSNGVPFTPASTQTYTVTGTDVNGCQNTDDVTVTVTNCDPLMAGFSLDQSICAGDCITLTDTSSGNIVSWYWDFGGGAVPDTSVEINPVVCFDTPGTFNIQLTVTDGTGASASTTNQVSVFANPTVTAQLDTLIDLGGEASLIATGSGPGEYQWTPSDYVDCDTCQSTFASPVLSTEYIVYLTDVNGCYGEDTVTVDVNFIEGIGVPSAFSPNGDTNNDILFVKGFGIEAMQFSVYNRYGQKVFETYNQDIGWDGTFKGKEENPGVFVWVLEYTLVNGSQGTLKGNTTLVR